MTPKDNPILMWSGSREERHKAPPNALTKVAECSRKGATTDAAPLTVSPLAEGKVGRHQEEEQHFLLTILHC